MIEKYTISFSVEADVEDKEELTALIWTLLKSGKQAYGPMPMTVPALKEIEVTRLQHHPLWLFVLPSLSDKITEYSTPVCEADHLHELFDVVNKYKEQGKCSAIVYVPEGAKQLDGQCVFTSNPQTGSWKNIVFFMDAHPELD